MRSQVEETKDKLICDVIADPKVELSWTILSSDIDDEDEAGKLLQEIVKLWVTIRGFSLTSNWMEQYKRKKQTTTKKAKSLRKSLNMKNPTTD